MADAVISVAVERAAAILEEQIRYEVKLLRGVKDEVRELSDTLGTIRTELDDADKRGVKEASVKKWLKKLEDVAYEMEDILDEWSYALANHKQKEKVRCSFIPSPSSSSCLCFKKLGVRHNIGIKIQVVKVKLEKILNEKDKFKFVPSLSPSPSPPPPPPPSDAVSKPLRGQSTSSIDQAKVQSLDIHKNKNEIVRRLMDISDVKPVSIVGMGGLGKTTLAQLVYNDTQIKNSFDLSIWICVSNPFDVAKIAREIVESVKKEIIPPNTSQLELVLEKLRDSISGKKFLLVLDDVWTEARQEWEPLKINLGHGAAGSKILVTSRKSSVARMMGSLEREIYYPQPLSNEECWSLLRRIALEERSEEECKEFEGVGMEIADKCKGLPLAANVLGSLLQFKDLKGWRDVSKSEIWQLEEAKVDLFPHLLLSYNELSPALKRCFSYCAVYPKDSYINAERLIREWMALGYLGFGSVRGNGELEVKGIDYFNSLAMRSLFQDFKKGDDGSIEECKMHDIVHDFALFLRENDAAVTKDSCQVCTPLLVSRVREYRSLVWSWDSPKHVCDCLASVRVLRVERGIPLGMKKLIHLRWLDLRLISEKDMKRICRLHFLQSLKLSFCFFEEIPLEIGNLVELRNLDLSRNEQLKVLPAEIGNLVELRHLDLSRNEQIEVLPAEIGNLAELRHLDLSRNEQLEVLPAEIGNLVELRHLDLSHNKRLKVLPTEIGNLVELRHLDLSRNEQLEVLPAGIGNLAELRHLDLSCNQELELLPAEIGNLAKLRHLDLTRNKKLQELPENVCNLVELQILNLKCCFRLQGLPEGIHKLQNLQHIVLTEIPVCRLRRLPPGLGELSGLRTLHTLSGSRFNELELGMLKKLNSLTGTLRLNLRYTADADAEELVKDAEEADLRSKIHIHTLYIEFIHQVNGLSWPTSSLWMELMEALQPNQQKLNELAIHGYRASRLPQWISSPLSSLKEISLYSCHELSPLPPFGKLPCLETLTVIDIRKLMFLGREFLGIESPPPPSSSLSTKGEEVVSFPKLKKLDIARCNEWSEWEDITADEEECSAVSILPCLEELHIRACKSLKMLPNRLLRKASSSLRSLNVSDSSLLKSQYGNKEGSGWRSITQNNPRLQLQLRRIGNAS